MHIVQTVDTARELNYWVRRANANLARHGYVLPSTMSKLNFAKRAALLAKSS